MARHTRVRGGGPSQRPAAPDTSALDNAVWAALAVPTDPAAWADLPTLVCPGATVRIKPLETVPDGWEIVGGGVGVQLVDTAPRAEPAPEAVRLGPADVPEILDLVAVSSRAPSSGGP